MISVMDLLLAIRPLHVCIGPTGHIRQVGKSFCKLGIDDPTGSRFLEVFEILRPAKPASMSELRDLAGQVLRLRLRAEPGLGLRGLVVDDRADGAILDLSFGIAVVDAVQRFGLTAQDFAPSDLVMELLFLQEAKSSAMAASFSLNARLNGARLAAETDALTDGLTGLYTHRLFQEKLGQELEKAEQNKHEIVLCMVDCDNFKTYNDTLGHPAGDQVLKDLSDRVAGTTRSEDIFARYGGEEFALICCNIDAANAHCAGMRIMESISGTPFSVGDNQLEVRISMGLADISMLAVPTATSLVEAADSALYRAKENGRNRIEVYSSDAAK